MTGARNEPSPEPFPWPEVMAFGLGVLKYAPQQFWSMSLKEVQAAAVGIYGVGLPATPLSRHNLDELMQRFPDQGD